MSFEYEDGDLGPDYEDDNIEELPEPEDEYLNDYPDYNSFEEDELENENIEDSNINNEGDDEQISTNNEKINNNNNQEDTLDSDEEYKEDWSEKENKPSINPEKTKKMKLSDLIKFVTSSESKSEKAKEMVKQEIKKKIKQKAMKTGLRSMLMAGGPILIIVVIALLLVFLIPMIASAFVGSDQESMMSNSTMTSEYFYGMRTAYIDDEQLTNELQLSYKNYIVDVLDTLDENSDITLQITLPIIEDNSTTVNAHINNLSIGIGSIVATGSANPNANFNDLYSLITHFGLTKEEFDLTHSFISDYISSNTVVSVKNGANLNNLLLDAMNDDRNSYMLNVCDKVMIKDYMATEAELNIADSYNFVASVYMPKQNIVMSNISYRIRFENEEELVNLKAVSNNETLLDYTTTTPWNDMETISLNLASATTFTCIDTSNLTTYSEGVSLFKAIQLMPSGAEYFKKNEDNIYSYLPNQEGAYYILFTSTNGTPFQFKEYNIEIVSTNITN